MPIFDLKRLSLSFRLKSLESLVGLKWHHAIPADFVPAYTTHMYTRARA